MAVWLRYVLWLVGLVLLMGLIMYLDHVWFNPIRSNIGHQFHKLILVNGVLEPFMYGLYVGLGLLLPSLRFRPNGYILGFILLPCLLLDTIFYDWAVGRLHLPEFLTGVGIPQGHLSFASGVALMCGLFVRANRRRVRGDDEAHPA